MTAVDDSGVFPAFHTPILTQLLFPKPPTIFLTCFCRGERRKYAGKKVHLNRGSNSQPPGHESDTLTTEPPVRGGYGSRTSIPDALHYDQSCSSVIDKVVFIGVDSIYVSSGSIKTTFSLLTSLVSF